MKAHFIASTAKLTDNIEFYNLIISELKKQKISLTDNWLKDAGKVIITDQGTPSKPWSKIYKENLAAISKADVIVAEVGNKSFLVGFQVAYALQMKKPILLLSRHENVDSVLGVSVNEEIIKFAKYNRQTLQGIIKNFIEENSQGGKKIRFNFFVDRKILNYLKWASHETGQTKSEVVRSLILKEIDKSKID